MERNKDFALSFTGVAPSPLEILRTLAHIGAIKSLTPSAPGVFTITFSAVVAATKMTTITTIAGATVAIAVTCIVRSRRTVFLRELELWSDKEIQEALG